MFSWAVVRRPVNCWPRWCWTPFSIRLYSTAFTATASWWPTSRLRYDTSLRSSILTRQTRWTVSSSVTRSETPMCSLLQFLMQYSHNLSLSRSSCRWTGRWISSSRTAVWTNTTDSSPSCCSSNTWCGPSKTSGFTSRGRVRFQPLIIHTENVWNSLFQNLVIRFHRQHFTI